MWVSQSRISIFSSFYFFSFLSQNKGDMTSQRLCSSLRIAVNSSLSSIFLNFADISILRNLKKAKIFQSLVFLLCNISTFDVFFKKKTCSNLARECEINDNNRKELEES